MTVTIENLIDGRRSTGSGAEIRDENPSRPDDLLATGRAAIVEDVDAAVSAARGAVASWARLPMPERAGVLTRAAAIIDEHAAEWGAELSREEGKTRPEGVGEVAHAADILRYFAGEATREQGEVFASPRPGERILVVRRPVGVIGAITPFNFPIAIPAWKLAPALVYGNTLVWKPSISVPVLAMRFAQALQEAGLPAGVLNLVIGEPDVGPALVDHAGIDALTFTGSTAVGRSVAARLAARGVPFAGEMGGKNAAVVLPDADLELAVEQVARGAFRATGQKCTATSRVIVDTTIADEFLARFAERAAAVRVGDALADGVDMGPLVHAQAKQRVTEAIGRARSDGLAGVYVPAPYTEGDLAAGHFVPPAVFELPDERHELWSRELFGPVVGVRRADDTAHAMRLANDSDYGLSAALFTRDLDQALAAIDDLHVGVLHVNSESAGADLHVPFGGMKGSGLGPREQGGTARDFVTETTTVYLRGA
ncbi:aldehyde dehydrogenase family protein [Jiangella alkaliphila]|uniref:Aldehyde dehydrogenase (NAD+) n=1 Tax=Jiangella alkaliphila TaxID=419479 RepID=A0A1H2LCW2_9ACTN|nr:aldehyde dehydrogenase family protein [Jiangella alkaliphila]SDU78769.1 aldehyde dehydrogenase (NAD+) [Jiangella alkaliphila]